MSKPRIRSIDVRGFRAFGSVVQPLELSSRVAVVWGPNSQGKTSLAEAFEFVFTGSIVRRDLLASAKDEFAGTLRNVHLRETDEVFVEIQVEHEGSSHRIRRTLLSDYAKKADCETRLEIDGQVVDEQALARIGIQLSQPPLAAPVLMQHTLPYVFSAGPKERSGYFKALLDVDDLDRFLAEVEAHGVDLGRPSSSVLRLLEACCARSAMHPALAPLLKESGRSLNVDGALAEAAGGLLTEVGADVPAESEARFASVARMLRSRQSDTLPLTEFGIKEWAAWELKESGLLSATKKYEEQQTKVEAEVGRLIPLFEAALRVDAIGKATESQLCPLCADGQLSAERVEAIRSKLRDTSEFRASEATVRAAISALAGTVKEAAEGLERCLPSFMKRSRTQRRERGFDVTRARQLVGPDSNLVVTHWLAATRSVLRARRALQAQVRVVEERLAAFSGKLSSINAAACEELRDPVRKVVDLRRECEQVASVYKTAESALLGVLPAAVAKVSKTEGWQDLLDLRAKAKPLTEALVEWEARCRVQKDLVKALSAVREGMGEVLDEKIAAVSGDVEVWWNLLRPGEPTFFSAVKRRTKATRTIDFKASISAHADRSNAEIRDAVAVLSYSQLQCLGLSLFLARAIREGVGFIVLDDPVLAGDEDHRPNFIHSVVPKLIELGVQVVVVTQDQSMLKDISNLFEHLNIDCFQVLRDPTTGTVVSKTSDGLDALLARIQPYLDNAHPEPRKTAAALVRDSAERFCKELLVKDLRTKGSSEALVSDFDGEVLQVLLKKVRPLLRPDEPGRLETIRSNMNPGNHDAPVPSAQEIKVAYGYLKRFKKDYLSVRPSL